MNTTINTDSLAVRRLSADDGTALRFLAGRDTAPIPAGELLGAEVGAHLVAAVSLTDGTVVADPFRATAAAVEMLELRAQQLKDRDKPKRGRKIRIPRIPRARGALAGSVPGSSKLLQL